MREFRLKNVNCHPESESDWQFLCRARVDVPFASRFANAGLGFGVGLIACQRRTRWNKVRKS
jgi:hypothetical protein